MSQGKSKVKRVRQTQQIIEMLFNDKTITDEKKEMILQWLISEEHQNIKTEILEQRFQKEFKYESDPVHALEMWPELSKRLNLKTDAHKVLRQINSGQGNIKPNVKRPLHTKHTNMIFRIAAVLLPAIAITATLYLMGTNKAKHQTADPWAEFVAVSAPDNELKTIILPDSSKVWLKSGGTIEYDKDFNNNRLVKLNGEAYFSVKASSGSKFTVEANDITATVLGTKFNIKAYSGSNETQITLDEGSVEVCSAQEKVMMKPHDRITLNKGTNRMKIEENINTHENNRSGLEFYDNTLHEILTAVAINYNMELEIKGNLPDYSIRFGFDYGESLDTILSVLKNAYRSFSYEITDDKISISAN